MSRYNTYSAYLTKRYGCRVHRISVDAGFSCPNRDGTISAGGCSFCDNMAFSGGTRKGRPPLDDQIKQGIAAARTRYNAKKFFIYFQAFTNTYASPATLARRYSAIKQFDDVVGLAIGTRPDCVDDKRLDVIEPYADRYEVWIEYGLQSIHDRTLDAINRGHTYEAFLNAVSLTRKRRGINICAHVILGLPGEREQDMIETAQVLARLEVDGVKIHPLHIVRGTGLEHAFKGGRFVPMTRSQYVATCVRFLEHLHPRTIIQRMGADCPRAVLVAPEWINDKHGVMRDINSCLEARNARQGNFFSKVTHGKS